MADKSENVEQKRPTPEQNLEATRLKGFQTQLKVVQLQIVVTIIVAISGISGIVSGFKSEELAFFALLLVIVFASVSLVSIAGGGHPSNSSTIDWLKALNDLERRRYFAREYGGVLEDQYNDRIQSLHFAALIEGKKDLAAALLEKGRIERAGRRFQQLKAGRSSS
jgi:hypothetical protein